MRQALVPQTLFALGLLASSAMSGCLCPPCGPEVEAAAPVLSGSRMIIWNGDDVKGTATGWSGCDQKGACQVTTVLTEGEGVDGSAALRVRAKGGGWLGGGWNWFGWWPENGGTDISQYDDVTFMIRMTGKDKNLLPDPNAVSIGFRCSNGKKSSPFVTLGQRVRELTDGKWHKVTIPVREFRKGKEGKAFDLKTVWEINFGTWSETPREYDLYLDDISVEKR